LFIRKVIKVREKTPLSLKNSEKECDKKVNNYSL
jgi:hypothetical protein